MECVMMAQAAGLIPMEEAQGMHIGTEISVKTTL
jgi:hypothetical protein